MVIYQQKPKQQEGDMRRYDLIWILKELQSSRLTPLNKGKLKNVPFKNPRTK